MQENKASCRSLHALEPNSIHAVSSSRRLILLASSFLFFRVCWCKSYRVRVRARAQELSSSRHLHRLASSSCRLLRLASSSCRMLLLTASWHNLGVCGSTPKTPPAHYASRMQRMRNVCEHIRTDESEGGRINSQNIACALRVVFFFCKLLPACWNNLSACG